MTIKLASLKADLEREEKGDWVEYPDWPGVAFRVSSLMLPAFTSARELLMQRLRKMYAKKPIPQEKATVEIGKLYCKHILHDWRGLDEAYSPETAEKVLSDPAYRAVIAAVEFCAARLADVDAEFVEDEVGEMGNSDAPSAGE